MSTPHPSPPWSRHTAVAALVAAAALGACGGSSNGNGPDGDGGSGSGSGTGTGTTGTLGEGLPCDVAEVVAQQCASCHGAPPAGGAPMTLLSYEDMLAPALSDPSKTMAEVSLERMHDTAAPMPPGLGPSTDTIAVFEAWIGAGMPEGDPNESCDPTNVELTCTSGTYWTEGNEGSDLMHPGGACLNCHETQDEGPSLHVAGTVYPSEHEEPDCNGLGGVTVEITDAEDRVYTLTTNAAGNFLIEDEDEWPVTFPIRASVSRDGMTIAMQDPVDSGDCNTCHTAVGAEGAPGRIVAP